MRKANSEELWEPVELLEIKVNRYAYEVQEKLDIYNISIQVSSRQVETLLNDVIEVELKEAKNETEVTRGSIHIRKGRTGKYYSVKNLHLHLTDFLELGFNMVQGDIKNKLIASSIFLIKLMEQLGINMEEEETAVCVALYRATKRYAITDDNIVKCITGELRESDYIELNEKKIGNILSDLIEMGVISVEEGRYEVTQEILFE